MGQLLGTVPPQPSTPSLLRNIVLWGSHQLVVLGSGPGHLPPWLGSSSLRDLSESPSDSGAESTLSIIRGRCSGGVGSPPWPMLDPWDPLAECGQPSGGGGRVQDAASGRALSQTQLGSPQPSLGPVPPLSLLSHLENTHDNTFKRSSHHLHDD